MHKATVLTNYETLRKEIHVLNGNSAYSIDLETGTKHVSRFGAPEYPENLDLKITNYCTGGCAWCHENSTTEGQHADWGWLKRFAESLPGGIEVAIGGGDPVDYPHISELLWILRKNNNIPSVTVNMITLHRNIEKFINDVLPFAFGVGVSLSSLKQFENAVGNELFDGLFSYRNTVFHVIAGLWRPNALLKFGERFFEAYSRFPKILILGYKVFGRGENYFNPLVEARIKDLERALIETDYLPFDVISFDNLAVRQLDVNKIAKTRGIDFSKHYLGDDGDYNMYVDAVKQEAAIASYSSERIGNLEPDAKEIFKKVKKELKGEGGDK